MGLLCALSANAWAGSPAPLPGTVGREHFPGPAAPIGPGPPVANAGRAPADCAACHPAVVAEWRQSEHATAFSDPFFQRSFAKEPAQACRFCHAPEAAAVRPAAADLAVGVACATCHVRDGTILAGPRHDTAEPAAPHAVRRDAALQSAIYCAACHQFGFLALPRKGGHRFESANLQQSTYAEWQLSAAGQAGISCQACHLPAVDRANGKKGFDHRMSGRSAELLGRAMSANVQVQRTGNRAAFAVALEATGAGHAVPTGDLFRRVDWLLFAPSGRLAAIRHMGRTWRPVQIDAATIGPALAKELATDQRVPPPGVGKRVFSVEVAATSGLWRWQVQHVRAAGLPAKGLVACRPGDGCALMAEGQLAVP